MACQCCDNCVYSVCDPELWRRSAYLGEPLVPRCANHPRWPGQLHDVPGVPCRNYRRKPKLPSGDAVRMIPLGDGFYAYVDAADYEWLSKYNWRLINGYACRRDKGKSILMHREIMKPPRGKVVDHIDANRVNNCRFNLRVCTPEQNHRNQRKRRGSSSRFKGVYYHKQHRKWHAECRCEGERHRSISFDDEVEAARAYDRLAVERFGEFARLNFPEEWPPERRAQVYAQRDAAKEKGKRRKAKGGREKTKAKTAGAKPRGTRDERRATKQGKKSRAETAGRRVQKRRTKPARPTAHRSRSQRGLR